MEVERYQNVSTPVRSHQGSGSVLSHVSAQTDIITNYLTSSRAISCSVFNILDSTSTTSTPFVRSEIFLALSNPAILSLFGSRMFFNLKEAAEHAHGASVGTNWSAYSCNLTAVQFGEPQSRRRDETPAGPVEHTSTSQTVPPVPATSTSQNPHHLSAIASTSQVDQHARVRANIMSAFDRIPRDTLRATGQPPPRTPPPMPPTPFLHSAHTPTGSPPRFLTFTRSPVNPFRQSSYTTAAMLRNAEFKPPSELLMKSGKNFTSWKAYMLLELGTLRHLVEVSCPIEQLDADGLLVEDLETRRNLAHSIELSLVGSIGNPRTLYDLWTNLCGRFSSQLDLKTTKFTLYSTRIKKGDTFASHFRHMKDLLLAYEQSGGYLSDDDWLDILKASCVSEHFPEAKMDLERYSGHDMEDFIRYMSARDKVFMQSATTEPGSKTPKLTCHALDAFSTICRSPRTSRAGLRIRPYSSPTLAAHRTLIRSVIPLFPHDVTPSHTPYSSTDAISTPYGAILSS